MRGPLIKVARFCTAIRFVLQRDVYLFMFSDVLVRISVMKLYQIGLVPWMRQLIMELYRPWFVLQCILHATASHCTLKHKHDRPSSPHSLNFPHAKSVPKSRGASNPVYLHKQSPTQLLWQKQLNLSCFVSTWFLLSLRLFACRWTIEAGEWQQIVGMHLNETNYYMLTAFTMADLKELGSFNLAPQDTL